MCVYDLLPGGEWAANGKKTKEPAKAKGKNTNSHIDGRSRMDVCLESISRVLDVNRNYPAQRGQPNPNTMRKSNPMQRAHPHRKSSLTRESNSIRESSSMLRKLNPTRVNIQNNMGFDAGGNRSTQWGNSRPPPRESNPMRPTIQHNNNNNNNNASTNWRGSGLNAPPPASDPVSSAAPGIVWLLGTDPVWSPGRETVDQKWLELGGETRSKTCKSSNAGAVDNGSANWRRSDARREEKSVKRRESAAEQVWSPGLDPVWPPRRDLGDCRADSGVAQTVAGEISWPRTGGSRLSHWTSSN